MKKSLTGKWFTKTAKSMVMKEQYRKKVHKTNKDYKRHEKHKKVPNEKE